MPLPAWLGAAALRVRGASDRVRVSVRRFRSQHGAVSAAAGVALLVALLAGGLALAQLASAGPTVVNANVATHYVNLPDGGRTPVKVMTQTTTISGKVKVERVRKIVTKEHTTTTRLPGQQTVLPGQTVTVKGATHTVTVAGPTKTETVTQTVTQTVEVTTTVEAEQGPPGLP